MGSMQCYGAVYTHNIKQIKGVAHKNGDVDGTCKPAFTCNDSFRLPEMDSGKDSDSDCRIPVLYSNSELGFIYISAKAKVTSLPTCSIVPIILSVCLYYSVSSSDKDQRKNSLSL